MRLPRTLRASPSRSSRPGSRCLRRRHRSPTGAELSTERWTAQGLGLRGETLHTSALHTPALDGAGSGKEGRESFTLQPFTPQPLPHARSRSRAGQPRERRRYAGDVTPETLRRRRYAGDVTPETLRRRRYAGDVTPGPEASRRGQRALSTWASCAWRDKAEARPCRGHAATRGGDTGRVRTRAAARRSLAKSNRGREATGRSR